MWGRRRNETRLVKVRHLQACYVKEQATFILGQVIMFWKTKLCLGILQQGALARGDTRLFSGKDLCFVLGYQEPEYWNRTHRDDQSQHESGIFAWRNRALLFNDRAEWSMDRGEIGGESYVSGIKGGGEREEELFTVHLAGRPHT